MRALQPTTGENSLSLSDHKKILHSNLISLDANPCRGLIPENQRKPKACMKVAEAIKLSAAKLLKRGSRRDGCPG